MLILQQAVVPHLKVTGTAAGVPTADRRTTLPTQWCRHAAEFYDLARNAHNVLVSGCTHCDVVNPTLQIRRIGNRSAVAL